MKLNPKYENRNFINKNKNKIKCRDRNCQYGKDFYSNTLIELYFDFKDNLRLNRDEGDLAVAIKLIGESQISASYVSTYFHLIHS